MPEVARLELLIMITEFGISAYLAARILGLPYPEAKMIYRIFKRENRIRSHFRKPRFLAYYDAAHALSNCLTVKNTCLRKLKSALNCDFLTAKQKQKIRTDNFDAIISQPCLIELEKAGKNFLRC